MALREQQRAATREQIIQAVHDVLVEEHPATLSMPQVATRAGIGLRTLYRYFPTKEALVDAASESWVVDPAVVGGRLDLTTLGEYLRTQWHGFTTSIGAIHAQHATPAGRAMRDSRLPRNRRVVRRAIDAEGVVLSRKDREQLVDLLVAVTSSSMYLELVDRMGHTEADAAELASWAVGALVERAKREGVVAT